MAPNIARTLLLWICCLALPPALGWMASAISDEEDGPVAEGETESAETGPTLDYGWYLERVAPVVRRLCGDCHADPRRRREVGAHFLRPLQTRKVRERHHARNFETISRLIVPGNPAASRYLLKAMGARNGGITHGGGAVLNPNTPEYGAIVDWITGSKLPIKPWEPPPHVPGQPDFRYYVARIAAPVARICGECHGGKGQARFKLQLPEGDAELDHQQHYENFETILKLLVPGSPGRSRFLRKPLPRKEGGLRHKGGIKLTKTSPEYQLWVDFIEGVEGPKLEKPGPKPLPLLTSLNAIDVQGEALEARGDYEVAEMEGAEQGLVVGVPEGRTDFHLDFRVQDAGIYTFSFRVRPGKRAMRWALDQRPMEAVSAPEVVGDGPYAIVKPRLLLDGTLPLQKTWGDLALDGSAVVLDGGGEEAGFLVAEPVRHTGVRMKFSMPPEEEGGDDVYLLFDMQDENNGKLLGLVDGGRRIVIGVMEGGAIRIVHAAPARPAETKDGQHTLAVTYFAGLVVGSLDGRSHVRANYEQGLGQETCGALTHRQATVHELALTTQFDVYKLEAREGAILRLSPGLHRLWVELDAESGWLDSLRIAPAGR